VRLESLEDRESAEARAELLELADRLRADGFDVEVAEPGEPVRAALRKGAAQEVVGVLNVVLTDAEHVAFLAGAIKGTLAVWSRGRRYFAVRKDENQTADVWTPDDEVLERVLLPQPDDDEHE
jgi:hypothetical protein